MAAKPPKPTPDLPPATVEPEAVKAPVAKVQLKKRDFIEQVTAKSGVKKPDAKAAIEATLALLAEALSSGQEVVVPPLGRIKVTREKEVKKGRVLMLRLQLDAGDKDGTEPLAEAAE